MKVFLTGATGVIGRRAVPRLTAAGHDVTAIARSATKADELRAAAAHPVTVDLFDADAVRAAVAGHDAIVNLATHIPPTSTSARKGSWAENDRIRTEGSRVLVAAALDAGVGRVVQESIAFLYVDGGDRWLTEDDERMATMFTPAVDAAEGNARRLTEHGGAGVVLRFGMFCAPESGHMADILRFARKGWLALPGRPDAYQSMVHADDAAAAVVAALDVAPGVYNVVDDEPLTRRELAAAVAPLVGRGSLRLLPGLATRVAAARVPNLVASQRVSNRRFRDAARWAPAHPSLREDTSGLLAPAGAGA